MGELIHLDQGASAPGSGATANVVTSRAAITAGWLASVLSQANPPIAADVAAVAVEKWRGKAFSDLYQIHVTYSGAADAPEDFMLKIARDKAPSTAARRRWKEHTFYTELVPRMEYPPVPRVYAAAYDPATQRSHLLLENLSATHIRPPTPLPPHPEQLRQGIASLAAIHARWWDHGDLAAAAAERDDLWIEKRTAATRRRLARFRDAYGDHLPSATLAALATAEEA